MKETLELESSRTFVAFVVDEFRTGCHATKLTPMNLRL